MEQTHLCGFFISSLILSFLGLTEECIRRQQIYRTSYVIKDGDGWRTGSELGSKSSFCGMTWVSSRQENERKSYDESGIYSYSSSR